MDVVYGVYCHFQQYFSYHMAVSFIGGGKREYLEKTTNLSQVTDKLHVYSSHKSWLQEGLV